MDRTVRILTRYSSAVLLNALLKLDSGVISEEEFRSAVDAAGFKKMNHEDVARFILMDVEG